MQIMIYKLLELIVNEKAPKKIKIYDDIFELIYDNYYLNGIMDREHNLYYKLAGGYAILTDIVEILEENDEWKDICELFNDSRYKFSNKQNGMTQEDRRVLDSNFDALGETINQLIKNQKYLKKKLEVKDE